MLKITKTSFFKILLCFVAVVSLSSISTLTVMQSHANAANPCSGNYDTWQKYLNYMKACGSGSGYDPFGESNELGARMTSAGGAHDLNCATNASGVNQTKANLLGGFMVVYGTDRTSGTYTNGDTSGRTFASSYAKMNSNNRIPIAAAQFYSTHGDSSAQTICDFVVDNYYAKTVTQTGGSSLDKDAEKAKIAQNAVDVCSGSWSSSFAKNLSDTDRTNLKKTYFDTLMKLSANDFKNKVTKYHVSTGDASKCTNILNAVKLNAAIIAGYKKQLIELCKSDKAALAKIAKYSNEQIITAGAGNYTTCDDALSADGGAASESTTTCAIDGIGWIVCPVLNFMAKIVDETYNVVETLLKVAPITSSTGKSALYNAWDMMRTFANVCFVIAFLIIIYSQLTSAGISNYGLKKMLPKLMLAAILVNVSFWLCAIAVDISNITGTSVKSLFDSLGQTLKTPDFGGAATGKGWEGLVGGTLALGAGAVGLYLAIGSILIALPAALLAILTAFLVLTLRQALIIILIVVSPLAFVAYLLPNTEEWFKKWRQLFQTLLFMFPIIAAIFGGSALASQIIMASATDANGDGNTPVQIMGALVAILPLVLTPIIMKTAGGVLNRFGGFINNPNKGPFDRLRKRAEGTASRIDNRRKTDRISRAGGITEGAQAGLGATGSRRRRAAAWAAGLGATGAVSTAEKDKYSQAGLDAAKRNYVADRAISDEAYAEKLGGSPGAASLVKAYSIEAKEQEWKKDVSAEKTIFEHDGTDFQQLHSQITSGQLDGNDAKKHAAVQRYFELANSDGVQAMIDELGQDKGEQGEALEKAQKIRKTAAEMLSGHPLKPVDLSGSNLSRLKTGEAIASEEVRITQTISEGKTTAQHISKMDVDEMRRWGGRLATDPNMLITAEPETIQSTYDAITEAEKDPRLNVNFGDRERTALAQMKIELQKQLVISSSTAGQKARQDAAAASYGPTI